jgi:hypothetical protein
MHEQFKDAHCLSQFLQVSTNTPHIHVMAMISHEEFDEAGNLVATYVETSTGEKSEHTRLDVIVSASVVARNVAAHQCLTSDSGS